MFDIALYYENLERFIKTVMERPEKDVLSYDILDTECILEAYNIALRIKHYQMKKGEIWQEAIGTYDGFINLKTGHETGLDVLSESKQVAIELKNRTNTDNSSSKKANLDKLAKFKNNNPLFICVYGTINDNTEMKTKTGFIKHFHHNGEELTHMTGYEFLKFIFNAETDNIIQFIKTTIQKYR